MIAVRALALAALVLAACTVAAPEEDPIMGDDGSGDSGTPPADDDPRPTGPDPDPEPDACPPSDLGIIDTLKSATATIDYSVPDDPESAAWRRLSGLVDPDVAFSIDLWDGYGAFEDSMAAPGDFPIADSDADPATCGLCVELTMTVGEVVHWMAATSGSISLESVDGDLKGSGQTISFIEVDDSDDEVESGCKVRIDRVVFDAPLAPYFPD